jgi:Domain of unknown function (DUF397)
MSSTDIDLFDANWRKSRRSINNGECVEVASARATIAVRDSVDPSGPMIQYPARTWQAFIAATKAGGREFRG